MANLKPVMPTLVGQTQTAQKSVHMVRMPNPLEGLGDSISGMTGGVLRLADSFGRVVQERDEADYRRTLNEAIAEADKRMQDEVFSLEGFSAEGALERAANIYSEVGGKFSGKLSGRNAKKFSEYWGTRRNTQANSVMNFERSQLQTAQLSANQTLLNSEVANYAATLEPAALEGAKNAYDDSVRITNGGRLVSAETLAAFRKDKNDGDGIIKLPDGRILRVVKEVKEGDTGVISEDQLAEIEKHFEKQAAAYGAGLQNVYDAAHAQVVERYLRDDRLAEATSYLDTVSADGYPQGISKGVLTECREAVGRKQELADISVETARVLSQIQAKAGADSIRYGGEDQDMIYTQTRREIVAEYTGEKWEQGQRILAMLDMQYRLLHDQQMATLTADTVSALTQMQKAEMTLPQQGAFIAAMKDSPLKIALQEAHARRVESYNNSTDPMFLAEQERRLNAFKLALGYGRADLDGISYDFSDSEQLKAYVLNLGFTAKNQERAAEYINNSRGRIDATLAANELANLLGMDNPAEALARYPNLLVELDQLKGSDVIEPSKMSAWLKTNITSLLSGEVSNYNSWWFDTSDSGKEYANSNVPVDDLYKSREQLTADWRRFNATRALNRGDIQGAVEALGANPTEKDLADFARHRGYQYEKGRYFLRGGK